MRQEACGLEKEEETVGGDLDHNFQHKDSRPTNGGGIGVVAARDITTQCDRKASYKCPMSREYWTVGTKAIEDGIRGGSKEEGCKGGCASKR